MRASPGTPPFSHRPNPSDIRLKANTDPGLNVREQMRIERIIISIGDVAGSGLAAAVTMAGVRQAIRGAAHVCADPGLILAAANRTVSADGFVTAFVGVIDPAPHATITYQSAGHPPPFLSSPDGSLMPLINQGLPLSLRSDHKGKNVVTSIPDGSLLAFYTDGLIESTRDIFESERRLRAALQDPAVRNAENPAKAVYHAVLVDGSCDDVAILTVKVG